MNKQILLSCVIEALQREQKQLETSSARTHQEAREAPSPMESHSDKTKFEMQTITDALLQTIEKLRRAVTTLEHFTFSPASDHVSLGALIETEEVGGKQKWYFMLPEGAGITAQDREKTIVVVTPQTPLGVTLMGKRAGEMAVLKSASAERIFKILSVE